MTPVYHEMKDQAGSEIFKLSHDARAWGIGFIVLGLGPLGFGFRAFTLRVHVPK